MLGSILEAIIPEDKELGLPSALAIKFELYVETNGINDLVETVVALLAEETNLAGFPSFENLVTDEKNKILEICRRKNFQVVVSFIRHVLRAYYSSEVVLTRIGAGSVPPFPVGNDIEVDDWSILEPVYERGKVYRIID